MDSHTVGTYLRTIYPGQFSEEWVVGQLACEPEAVRELMECWVPTVTPQILERSVGVFAAYLGIDRKRLLQLMTGGGAATAGAGPRVEFARPRASAIPRHDAERPRLPLGAPGGPREAAPRPVAVTWQRPKRNFNIPGAAAEGALATAERGAALAPAGASAAKSAHGGNRDHDDA
ncbi:MAG: hypothetical protein ISP90_05120 [Nevskia sp.]|nr:hypothetical protein [Nevskia sp.]